MKQPCISTILTPKPTINSGKKTACSSAATSAAIYSNFPGWGLDWGNTTGTLRWNHIFNDRLFSNTSLIYSDFDYGFGIDDAGTAINLSSGIFNYNLKQDFNWYVNPTNSIQFGWNTIYHVFKPGRFVSDDDNPETEDMSADVPFSSKPWKPACI